VRARLEGRVINVRGSVTGDVVAHQRLSVLGSGTVTGDVVQVEARSPLVVSQGLEKAGFARPQLVVAESDGFLHGASDPRKDDGTALDTETA
jgi:cytoskeletal protein CcmA (bactofilin family)